MVHDLGIQPLAEGVEREGDHEICRQMGFTSGQGFLYGYPMLPKRLAAIQAGAPELSDAS
jgi:EAL domain-containing protein (putative c-di-GMP-specific phosphodiesterase class I)